MKFFGISGYSTEKVARLKERQDVEGLIKVLRNGKGKPRALAWCGLISIGTRSIQPLIKLLDDSDETLKGKAAGALDSITAGQLNFGEDHVKWKDWWCENEGAIPDIGNNFGENMYQQMMTDPEDMFDGS